MVARTYGMARRSSRVGVLRRGEGRPWWHAHTAWHAGHPGWGSCGGGRGGPAWRAHTTCHPGWGSCVGGRGAPRWRAHTTWRAGHPGCGSRWRGRGGRWSRGGVQMGGWRGHSRGSGVCFGGAVISNGAGDCTKQASTKDWHPCFPASPPLPHLSPSTLACTPLLAGGPKTLCSSPSLPSPSPPPSLTCLPAPCLVHLS